MSLESITIIWNYVCKLIIYKGVAVINQIIVRLVLLLVHRFSPLLVFKVTHINRGECNYFITFQQDAIDQVPNLAFVSSIFK